MAKFKTILIGAIAIAGLMASLMIRHKALVRLRENDALMRQQDNQLAELLSENQHLSNRISQAMNSPVNNRTTELVKLRSQAEALRKQLAENRQSGQSEIRPWIGLSTHSLAGVSVVSDSESGEYAKQLDRMASEDS